MVHVGELVSLPWRTFWLILLLRTGIQAQYYDRYGNRPPYTPWNVPPPSPQSLPPNPPYFNGPRTGETFTDVISYNPGFSDGGDTGGSPPFPAVHEYEIATTRTTGTPEKDTPLFGGYINTELRLEKSKSPYLAREDVFIEKNGALVIEAGVVVKFAPLVGLTVRGVLDIQVSGTPSERPFPRTPLLGSLIPTTVCSGKHSGRRPLLHLNSVLSLPLNKR